MDATIRDLLARVERSITRVQATRAERFNLAWPIGHPDRDQALNEIQASNPSLYEAVARIERSFGPGMNGCERALAE